MKITKYTRLLLAGAILITSVTACSTNKTESSSTETTTALATESTITEFSEESEETYINDDLVLNNTNEDVSSLYYIGDHQILTFTGETDSIDSVAGDGTIPEDFEERYADQPELVRLAHEYAAFGEFNDFFTYITEVGVGFDAIYINNQEYALNHGFNVWFTSDNNTEESYTVALLPEELLYDYFTYWYSDDITFTETDYGYSIYSECWNDYTREVNYYTDSQLLVEHYSTEILGVG